MLVCCEDDNQTDDEDISPKKESKRFIWNHGSMFIYDYLLMTELPELSCGRTHKRTVVVDWMTDVWITWATSVISLMLCWNC